MSLLGSVRIVDFSRYIAGPYCASILGDLGADVIRVEPVGGGEDRRLVPLDGSPDGALFLQMNRNKRSLALDARSTAGRGVIERLIGTADVVVTNMPAGALARHGLDYETICAIKPDIICINVSAYGPSGPLSERTGFDAIGQGISGAAHLAGAPGAPARTASSYVDYGTGLAGAVGVLAALLQRRETGKGQKVDASLLATALTFMNAALIEEAVLGLNRHPYGNRSPNSGPSDIFPTQDGAIAVQVVGPQMFGRWAHLVGRSDLVDDDRFATDASRGENGEVLSGIMTGWTRQRTSHEAIALLSRSGIPAGPIYSPRQTLADEQIAEAGIFERVAHPGLDRVVPLTRLVVQLQDLDDPIRRAPRVGEHSVEILAGLGYSDGDIATLLESGCVSAVDGTPGDGKAGEA
jgi:crotonobetainyl-CoA:carnitine CoA-transferase CaiB-like acyl-CoA transferase